MGGALPAAAGDLLYRYVDKRGVVHFTNLPTDGRYRLVGRLSANRRLYTYTARRLQGRPPRIADYDPLIANIARSYGIDPALVKAVIAAESNFDPHARSHKGAMGLMQLMPQTAREMGVYRPYHSEENVRGGSRYLRFLLDRYPKNLRNVLAAYNAGPGAVDRYGGIPPFPETVEYVSRVLAYYQAYDGDFTP